MPSAFARGTDDTGKKGTTSLIRAEGAALGGITITAAERATGSWARRAPVAGAEVAAGIMLSATSSRSAIPIPVTVSIAVGPITALVQTVNTGGVALDVTKGKLFVVNRIPIIGRAKRHIPVRSRTEGPVDTRGGKIPNTRFGVGVDQGRNAAKAQVVGKIAVITVNVAERIDLGLEERDNVSIFRVCNRT